MQETARSGREEAELRPDRQVKSRLVLNFPGFEQTGTEHQIGRLGHCAAKTGEFWNFSVVRESLETKDEAHHATAAMRSANAAGGKEWSVDTRLVQFQWNDIVHAYENRPFPSGFLANIPGYLAFFRDGTVGRYARASMRYWGFTIFPVLLVALFLVLAGAIAFIGGAWLPLTGTMGLLVKLIAMLAITLLLCKWPGDRLYLAMTIADWAFARDMVLQSNPQIEERFAGFANVVGEEIARSSHDEIIIVGHSFGSLWAVGALAAALEKQPGLLENRKVTVLALGSSMLKIALAPQAAFIRRHWARVMAEPSLFWHEVQTKDDLIAFYKCDPFEEAEIPVEGARYMITRIRFGEGMEKKRYKSMRKSFYRIHRQYILNYDRRVAFDYMLRLFGPFDARDLAHGGKEVTGWLDNEGRISKPRS